MSKVVCFINCDQCSKTVDSPVELECGSTVCLSHVGQYSHQEKFECELCLDGEHAVPKDGFKVVNTGPKQFTYQFG